MTHELIGSIVIVWLIFRLVMAIVIHLRAGLYDFLDTRQKKRISVPLSVPIFKRKPLISIIIPSRNAEQTIKQCLESIVCGLYKETEIIVVDGASSDDTKQIVKTYAASNPDNSIHLVARRTASSNDISAAKKYVRGELVMVLPPQFILDTITLDKAAEYFAANDLTGSLRAHIKLNRSYSSAVNILQQFEHLFASRVRKSKALFSAPHGSLAGVIARSDALSYDKLTILSTSNFYTHIVEVFAQPAQSYKQIFGEYYRAYQVSRLQNAILSAGALLLDGIVFAYLVYLAVAFHNTMFFMISWIILCTLLLAVIWTDEQLNLQGRIRLSLLTPIMYSLFLVQRILKLLAFARLVSKS